MSSQDQQAVLDRWQQLSFVEQMANVGSEVERSLGWRNKNKDYGQRAFERSLDLMDMTMGDVRNKSRLKELARVREAWCDFFAGSNQFFSTEQSWKKYFYSFNFAARRNY